MKEKKRNMGMSVCERETEKMDTRKRHGYERGRKRNMNVCERERGT